MEIKNQIVENPPLSPLSQNPPQIQNLTLSPLPSPRSDNSNNPYPTTFVQADTSNFKSVVQMLTGSPNSRPEQNPSKPGPPIRSAGIVKKPSNGNKLYERRNSLKNGLNGLMINPMAVGVQRGGEILSPSMLNFPNLKLSPVTPLILDNNFELEERAIKEKGFYLHPSPREGSSGSGGSEPRLLSLFPVTSPRVAAETNSV